MIGRSLWAIAILAGLAFAPATNSNAEVRKMGRYSFDGTISREVLEDYLARAVTQLGLSHSEQRAEDIRMLKNVGAKYIGRAAYLWGNPGDDDAYFKQAKETADLCHRADPEMILQACIFEAIYEGVNKVPVPEWVFREFGQKPEKRDFRYEAMLFDHGKLRDFWAPGGSVPDMSKLETRMWFFYRGRRYIDSGYEAIHFGQVHLMDQNDPDHKYWLEMLARIRGYAKKHARRHLVLCDAHTHGIAHDGKLMFDFHAFPLRIKEVVDQPEKGVLEAGYIDSIFGKSLGGITPSGWKCERLPYIVEIDNWGASGKEGQRIGGCWVWGYDEISWFARQSESYRNEWLRYAWKWVRKHDSNGYLQMPGSRCLAVPASGIGTYCANTQTPASPHGFGQEETIKAIWSETE